jgi:hypothetical protein
MEPIQPNSGPAGAPASAVTPDAATAELLERRAAGEKLSQAEYGRLGAFARWLKDPFGKSRPAAQPAGAGSQPGNAAAVASVSQTQAPDNSLESVEVDDGICQRTTAAILRRADTAVVGKVERSVNATADACKFDDSKREKALARMRRACALSNDDQKLIVDLSPDVCRELGINPRQFAVGTVVTVLGLHAFTIWEALDEMKEMRRDAARPTAPDPALTHGDPSASKPALTAAANREGVSTTTIPVPPRPKGEPPEVS